MDRRGFLRMGGAALAALSLPRRLRAEACPAATTADRYGYGPYYLEGAPERAAMAVGEPGERLLIRGTTSDCAGPLAGVSLEVWHATAAGCYIHPDMPACDDHGNPQVSRLWARLVSDAQGRFAFSTIKPGVYLNGDRYRPSHIHFRIRSPAGRSPAVDLVTQLYFRGDPYIAGDYGADDPGAASRIIPLSPIDSGWAGDFAVVLPGGTAALGRGDPFSDPALRAFDACVQRSGDVFRVFLPPVPAGRGTAGENHPLVEARVYDAAGNLVRRSLHASLPIEIDAALWPRGVYQAQFRWETGKGPRTESLSLRR